MNIIVFTSSSLRHRAFARLALISNSVVTKKVFFERDSNIISSTDLNCSKLKKDHFNCRKQSEVDFFQLFLNSTYNKQFPVYNVEKNWFSSPECLAEVENINPDLILVYGTSIIRGKIIEIFRNRILNLHLGLAPYYRGSGTNYFPFVNNQPEFAGATYMFLDEGIDTGEIIHQIRPTIFPTDSFHVLSNRFLIKAFYLYIVIASKINSLESVPQSFLSDSNIDIKIYKKIDFTDESILKLHNNFKLELLSNYLNKKSFRDSTVPIFSQNI